MPQPSKAIYSHVLKAGGWKTVAATRLRQFTYLMTQVSIDICIMSPSLARQERLQRLLAAEPVIRVTGSASTFPLLRSLISEAAVDVAVVDPASMAPVGVFGGDVLLVCAANVAGVRLIDNLPLTVAVGSRRTPPLDAEAVTLIDRASTVAN